MRVYLIAIFTILCQWAIAQTTEVIAPTDTLRVRFAPEGGFYDGPQTVTLRADGATAIYYTLDGSPPNAEAVRYLGPISVDETTVLRAAAYVNDSATRPTGQTYLINEPRSGFPVVSIGVAPGVLFSPSTGIFVQGGGAVDSVWHKPGANFWTRREFAVQLEFYETDGRQVHNSLSGLRLFGGMSRLFPQKSLALVARKRYGASRFKMPIFGEDEKKSFKFLVLRNSGSDFGKSHFRDGYMTTLVKNWDLETQAFRPSHVYINGAYWGIYNIREKVNRYFVEAHGRDVDRDSIDLLEHYLVRKRGSRRHYQQMLDFLERYDLDLQENFDYLGTFMEIDNFMEHQIAEIYFDNRDAGGNIKYWRPAREGGRWRWILYDTDWGFGLHGAEAYRHQSLAFHTDPNGPHWPNPPWSTFLLRKLLQNESFRHRFVNRFADHLNTDLSADRATEVLDSFYFMFRPEIGRHLERWRLSGTTWEKQVAIMREFAIERPAYLRAELSDYFAAGGPREVRISSTGGGQVLVNDHLEVKYLNGEYFANYPIRLRAVPAYGHRFVGWERRPTAGRELEVPLREDRSYRFHARFEPFKAELEDQIIINEVCPRSKKTDDWVELYNHSDKSVSLAGWVLTDRRNEFTFPAVELPPNDYLIVCKDADKFRAAYPEAYNVVGGMGFGIDKRGEVLGLYTAAGAAVDSFSYRLEPLDTSFTLSLRLPTLDNADVDNWELGIGYGSPNRANPRIIAGTVRREQAQWMQIGAAGGVVMLCLLVLYWRREGAR